MLKKHIILLEKIKKNFKVKMEIHVMRYNYYIILSSSEEKHYKKE